MTFSLLTVARGAVLLGLLIWASTSFAQNAPSYVRAFPEARSGPAPAATDAPLSTGAWWAHGTLTLAPLGGLYAASRVHDERLWVTAAEAGAGMVAAWVPSRLLFLRAQNAGPRWTEMEVITFGMGLVLSPPLAGLGTWALGEWGFHGSRDRGDALLGAMGGAAAGTLLSAVVYGLLDKLAGPSTQLRAWRQSIALGLIGVGSTMGYQWAGHGPRPR